MKLSLAFLRNARWEFHRFGKLNAFILPRDEAPFWEPFLFSKIKFYYSKDISKGLLQLIVSDCFIRKKIKIIKKKD